MEGSNLSAHSGLKNDYVETENWRYGVVQYIVHMYYHFVNDLSLCVGGALCCTWFEVWVICDR